MPIARSGKTSKSRSTSKGAKAASRKSAAKLARKPAKKKASALKAPTKTKSAKGSKKSVSQKKAKRTSSKTRAKKSGSQAAAKQAVGIVAKAKSVLKPVLAGAAAAAAVIAGKNPDSVETEQSGTTPNVAAEASQTERNAEEPTPNPQRLKDGVLIDRRR